MAGFARAWPTIAILLLAAAPAAVRADAVDLRSAAGQQAGEGAAGDDPAVALGWSVDRTRRITLPLEVGGSGPYDFVVDTGAERSIISQELARELGLSPGRRLRLSTIAGIRETDSVKVPVSDITRRSVRAIEAPTLGRAALGAAGLIGVDLLENLAVRLDFVERVASVRRAVPARVSAAAARDGEIVVRAKRSGGRLILTDIRVDGIRTAVVIDSGAEHSIANAAFARKLRARGGSAGFAELQSVAGELVTTEVLRARGLEIGPVTISNLAVAALDSPVFASLGLDDRPALLLGIDALQLFGHVDLDFRNRRVAFAPRPNATSPAR